MTSDIRTEFLSDPEGKNDLIICEVYLQDVYIGGIFAVRDSSAANGFVVHFASYEPSMEALALDDYVLALTVAKERYVERLLSGPNPFAKTVQ
jgi:hypothetical protein